MWRRIFLAVSMFIVFRVIKHKARGLGEVEAKLLWLTFLSVLANPAAASVKARATEDRIPSLVSAVGSVNTTVATLNTAISPITGVSGKAVYLATVSKTAGPTKAGGNTTPTSGAPSFTTIAGAQSYCAALANNLNDLNSYVSALATVVNGIYDSLQSANIFS